LVGEMAIVVHYGTQMIMYLVRSHKVATPNHVKQARRNSLMPHVAAVGRSIFGPHCWQRPTARILGIDHRTLGRWQAGEGGPDFDDVLSMIGYAREHYEGVRRAHDAALRALQLAPPSTPQQPTPASPQQRQTQPLSPIRPPTIYGPGVPPSRQPTAPVRRG